MGRRSVGGTYPENWRELALTIKHENGWRCIRCGHEHDPWHGYTLTIHHADMNPANNAWWNTLCLCQRCHLHIQGKVVLDRPWMLEHTPWFRPYVAGYYAHSILGLELSREEVEARLDELLRVGQPWLEPG